MSDLDSLKDRICALSAAEKLILAAEMIDATTLNDDPRPRLHIARHVVQLALAQLDTDILKAPGRS